jgi:hypothetical protein
LPSSSSSPPFFFFFCFFGLQTIAWKNTMMWGLTHSLPSTLLHPLLLLLSKRGRKKGRKLREGERKRKRIKVPPMPKVDQKTWTSFTKKEREKVERGRKKKKNNEGVPYAKSRPKNMNKFQKERKGESCEREKEK